jgi:GNAT superfamily N-acetyltransferase
MRVREGVGDDAVEVAALVEELGYPLDPTAAAQRIARGTERILVAEDDARLLGLATVNTAEVLIHAQPIARLNALVVRASARRDGVGRRLVQEAIELARQLGCEGLELTSALRPERHDAHRFYEALGFERTSYRFWLPFSGPG